MAVKFGGLLNLLLVFVPIAFVLRAVGVAEAWVFACSCIAIIPLAGLMGKSTEMLADRMGSGIGGLMNATFGNAAEMIIAVVALRAGLVDVVKASITGSILGNILLVLGASCFVGGLRFERQRFNSTAAGLSATMLALAAIGLLVPAIFHANIVFSRLFAEQRGHGFPVDAHETELSLEISIVLFVTYLLMLLFSLKTHRHLYDGQPDEGESPEDPAPKPHFSDIEGAWSVRKSVGVLVAATVGVAFMSELLVGAIEATSEQLGWTELFVGVIVVAIVGNAAEHSTAILMAHKNQMDLAFQIAVGSGLQIALFVAPVLVFISFLPGFSPLNLVFSMMEVLAVGVSVLIVGLVAFDGESNWLEGLLLLAVYVILAIAFYHLPETHEAENHGSLPPSRQLPVGERHPDGAGVESATVRYRLLAR